MAVIFMVVITALAAACGVLLWLCVKARNESRALAEKLAEAERQKTQDQDALRQRKQLDDIKDEFISTVSHELRTPLTSIRGALGLLSAGLMGQMDEKAQNLLRIASTNTDRLVRLINDILDLERMDSGRSPLNMRRCSLPDLVKSAVETMSAMGDAAGVRIEAAPASGAGEDLQLFDGDPDRIQQVLCNLLSNAIKFSPRGSAIHISRRSEGEDLVLTMEDQGRGVPADKLESIFDRFIQVDPADARQKGGTGLGLAICRSILAQHGGAIWAERNDTDGNDKPGTKFILRIPRAQPNASSAQVPVAGEGVVLVVDDDATVRQLVGEQLRRNGYTVLETDRGEHALHIAEAQKVEAVLLDLYMPGMTGWETLERLKRNPATSEIPVVVLSVLSPTSSRAEGAQLLSSAQGWVQKPFNEELLLAELGRVLHSGSGSGRVLLVEDDEVLATVVQASLQHGEAGKQSIHVQHVRSMAEAKATCTKQSPDLMILDLSLPDGDGFALVEWLREQPALRTLPLVVYSGREVTAAEMEQLRLGPTQFLTKASIQPHHVQELVLAMVRHLRNPTLAAQSA